MEKRSNTRVIFEVKASLKYKRKTIECKVINLSLNGILLKLLKDEIKIPEDEKVRIVIYMEGTTSKVTVKVEGIIVRSDSEETAVVFNSIDLDSFIHLKNIISYNEGNEEKIMKEFYKKVKTTV